MAVLLTKTIVMSAVFFKDTPSSEQFVKVQRKWEVWRGGLWWNLNFYSPHWFRKSSFEPSHLHLDHTTINVHLVVLSYSHTRGKQSLGTAVQSCAMNLQSHSLWNGCFEDREQVCGNWRLVTIIKTTLVPSRQMKTAKTWSQSAFHLQLNGGELAITCNRFVTCSH